jgi:hypothetical protein
VKTGPWVTWCWLTRNLISPTDHNFFASLLKWKERKLIPKTTILKNLFFYFWSINFSRFSNHFFLFYDQISLFPDSMRNMILNFSELIRFLFNNKSSIFAVFSFWQEWLLQDFYFQELSRDIFFLFFCSLNAKTLFFQAWFLCWRRIFLIGMIIQTFDSLTHFVWIFWMETPLFDNTITKTFLQISLQDLESSLELFDLVGKDKNMKIYTFYIIRSIDLFSWRFLFCLSNNFHSIISCSISMKSSLIHLKHP